MIEQPPPIWMPPKPAIIKPAPVIRKASFLPGMFPAAVVAGGTPAFVVPTDHRANNNGANNYNFSSVDFGDEHPSRRIIVAVTTSSGLGSNLTTCAIAGSSATEVTDATPVHIFIRHVPTGATGTVSLSYSGAQASGTAIRVWSAYGLRSELPVDVKQATLNVGVAGADLSCNTRSGGIVVAAAGRGANGTGQTWVGVTEDAEQTSSISNTPRSFAHANVKSGERPRTVTVTSSNTSSARYARVASFR